MNFCLPIQPDHELKGMTYQLKDGKQQALIEMMLFLRSGSRRQVSISYTIDRAVQNHLDAELFQQRFFNREDQADTIGSVSLKLSCSGPYTPEKAWYLASSLTPFETVDTDGNCLGLEAESSSDRT